MKSLKKQTDQHKSPRLLRKKVRDSSGIHSSLPSTLQETGEQDLTKICVF